MLDRFRAMWWLRLQAIWWHTILRRPFDSTVWDRWVSQHWKRSLAPLAEPDALRFPFRFRRSLGARILMSHSPRLRSSVFTALDA